MVSGLRINFHKSCLVNVGRKEHPEDMWADAFRCTRFGTEESSLLKKVICAKYGIDQRALWWNWHTANHISVFIQSVGKLMSEQNRSHVIAKEGFQLILGNVRRQMENALAWRHCPNGIFSMGSFRRCLEEELHVDSANTRFTWQGGGCIDPITTLLVDIKERCMDKVSVNVNRSKTWVPSPINSLFFNVDGSVRGSPGDAGIRGVLWDSNGGHSINYEVIIVSDYKVAASPSNLCLGVGIHLRMVL
ncbi:hypothetical protein Ddye_011739 [Dipteronia dyeriana]|uniref:Uncharacterized protein n=1 Tax=Dipteronia dyeriana TaxID=168575 RepID=A0AAE0CIK4_9ROSI|nr:hypothetical protein Ddye_011739 [Dipteronia dyeriana]